MFADVLLCCVVRLLCQATSGIDPPYGPWYIGRSRLTVADRGCYGRPINVARSK
jgi:hypothetical protein